MPFASKSRILGAFVAALLLPPAVLADTSKIEISEHNLAARRSKVVLEVTGTLVHEGTSPEAKSETPTNGVATFLYSELPFETKAIRYYTTAEASLAIGKEKRTPQLRENRRLIETNRQGRPELISPLGTLSRDELELISLPFSSSTVDQLFPIGSYSPDKTWTFEEEHLKQWLNVDAITANDVSAKLVAAEENLLRGEISGRAVGSVDGSMTEFQLSGKMNFDTNQNRITWLAIKIDEERDPSAISPGFKVSARLRMAIDAADEGVEAELRTKISEVTEAPSEALKLIEYRPQGREFYFIHGRDWHLASESNHVSIMRLVRSGETIAQCNIRVLPRRDKQAPLTLSTFQAEVTKSIGKPMEKIVSVQESETATGLRQLRVTAIGAVSNTAVQWICYHVSNAEGLEVSCVFTMTGEKAEAFGAADFEILNSLTIDSSPERQAAMATTTENR